MLNLVLFYDSDFGTHVYIRTTYGEYSYFSYEESYIIITKELEEIYRKSKSKEEYIKNMNEYLGRV